jgi:hypothetical protein
MLGRIGSSAVVAGIVFSAFAAQASATTTRPNAACPVPASRDIAVTRTVYQTGVSLGVSDKVMLAGFEAGWVESHMKNLTCGDRASLGVFQQQVGYGWGTADEIMDPVHAATEFFTRAKAIEPRHAHDTAGHLAQAVQISCCPERYDQARGIAQSMLDEVKALPASDSPASDNTVRPEGAWAVSVTVNSTHRADVVLTDGAGHRISLSVTDTDDGGPQLVDHR